MKRGLLLLLAFATGCAGPAAHRPAPGAAGPYSGSVTAQGMTFVAGQIGDDRSSFATELGSALDKVEARLAAAGHSLRDVVSVTVYLTDMNHYDELNRIYAERFPAPYPARTCVAVAALPKGASVEVQVIAAR